MELKRIGIRAFRDSISEDLSEFVAGTKRKKRTFVFDIQRNNNDNNNKF
jgi:hypothetical protein